MKTQTFADYSAFLQREDKSINGVTQAMADAFPNWSEEKNNDGCWNCSGCSDCYRCSGCSNLENAQPVAGKEGESGIQIPVVENIHVRVLAAVSREDALDMEDWHSCNTTHCRGGWVITLAGAAGKKLETQTSSEFAAMAIYSKSSPIRVSPVRFYESNEVAMADIKHCAAEEVNLAK